MPADPSPPPSTAGSAGAWKHSDGRRALRPSLRGRRRDPRRRPSLLGAGFAQRGDGLAPTPDEESAALLQISTVPVAVPVPVPVQARPGPAPHGPFAPVERSTRVAHAAGLPPHQRLHCRVRHGAGRRGEGRVLPLCLSFFFSLRCPSPGFLLKKLDFASLLREVRTLQHACSGMLRSLTGNDQLELIDASERQFIRDVFDEMRVISAIVLGVERLQQQERIVQYQSSGSGADRDDVDSPAGASHCPHTFRSACLDKRIRLRHHRSGAARAHAGRQARRYGKRVGRRQDPGGAGVTHGGAGGGVNRGSGSTKSSAGGRPRHRRTERVRHGRHQTAHSEQRRVGPGQERQQLRQLRWLAPLSLATPPSPPPLLPRPPPPPPAALHRPGACSAPALPCIRVPNCCCSRVQSSSPSSIFYLMHKRRMER